MDGLYEIYSAELSSVTPLLSQAIPAEYQKPLIVIILIFAVMTLFSKFMNLAKILLMFVAAMIAVAIMFPELTGGINGMTTGMSNLYNQAKNAIQAL